MDYQALAKLVRDTEGVDWSMGDGAIAAKLNEASETAVRSRFITTRTIFAEIDAATAQSLLGKFKAAQASDDVLAVAWAAINSFTDGGGIDIGKPATRALLDGFVQQGVFTQAEADSVKALANVSESPAEYAGLGRVGFRDVARARERVA